MSNNPLGGLGSLLGNMFGQQTPHRMEDYQDFSQRYDRYNDPNDPTDDSHFDPQDVQGRYRQMLRTAPPQVLDQAHEEAFQRLSPQQREQLAFQMFQYQQQQGMQTPRVDPRRLAQDPRAFGQYMRRSEQQNPGMLDQLFGGAQGPLSNPLVKMALAGAAAAAAKRFLGGGGGGMMGSGGGLGGLLGGGGGLMGGGGGLGGLLGGGLGGGSPLGGGGLGGLLGGALGASDEGGQRGGGNAGPFGGTEV